MNSIDFLSPARFNIFVLRIFGAWVTPDSSFLYKIYALFAQIITGYTFALNLTLMLPKEHDLESIMLSMPVSFTMVGYSLKLSNLYIRRHQIKEFLILINSNESQVDDKNEKEIIVKAIGAAKKLVYISFGIFLTAGISALLPLMSLHPKVPYPILYPDWRQSRTFFRISCVYQVVCVLVATTCNVATDNFIPCFLIILSGQVDALNYKLKQIGKVNFEGKPAREHFIECIVRHKHLITVASELQRVFSVVTFIQICLSGLIACGLIFQLSLLSPMHPALFFKYFTFALAMFIEIFIPCYVANGMKIKSEELKFSVYSSNWIGIHQKLKKVMIIFTERLRNPILITVGGILFLGMENFMTVLRFSYSFYSLLRRIHAPL